MQPPFPCPTATWHNDTYAAISPQREEVTQAGKTIIITGAGSGIGQSTAVAFASAGAAHIVLVGRTEATLAKTKSLLPNICKVTVHTADVNDEKAMQAVAQAVAQAVGTWDVFILNAGYISTPSKIADGNLDDYWKNYETNVRSVVITAKAFLPTANENRAVLLGTTAGPIIFPPASTNGISGYLTSKMAQVNVLTFLASENPHLFVASVHPGMIETAMFRTSKADPNKLPMDTLALPADFMVWMSSSEAAFLNGRFVFANWDVEELKAKAEEIVEKDLMVTTFRGWPYSP